MPRGDELNEELLFSDRDDDSDEGGFGGGSGGSSFDDDDEEDGGWGTCRTWPRRGLARFLGARASGVSKNEFW